MEDREVEVRQLVEEIAAGRITVEGAVDRLLDEMGRGGRILVVDETSYGLDEPLSDMNYTVVRVPRRLSDEEIKEEIGGKVFITRNGERFSDPKDMEYHGYGLVWLTSTGDDLVVAEKVKDALMNARFKRNLKHMIKV